MSKHALRRASGLIFAIVGLTLMFGGLNAYKAYKSKAVGNAAAASAATPVATSVARSEQIPEYLEAIGSLRAVRQVLVAPEVEGTVTAIHFESGGIVAANAQILQINDAPEQGDLQRFKGQLWFAEREHDRLHRLFSKNAVSESEAEAAESRLLEVRGQVKRTEAIIAQKRISAPFAGQLGIRLVDPGQYLQRGQSIVTLTDLQTLYVNFTIAENFLTRVKNDLSVEISVDAYPTRAFPAVITTIDPQIYAETRAIQIQAQLNNQDLLLRPGMFASVRVLLPTGPSVIAVPETALDRSVAGDSVYVVRKSNSGYSVDRAPVKVGRRAGGRVVIESGIVDGDLIVTSGQINLAPGSPVSLSEGQVAASGEKTPENGGTP